MCPGCYPPKLACVNMLGHGDRLQRPAKGLALCKSLVAWRDSRLQNEPLECSTTTPPKIHDRFPKWYIVEKVPDLPTVEKVIEVSILLCFKQLKVAVHSEEGLRFISSKKIYQDAIYKTQSDACSKPRKGVPYVL